MAHVPSDGPLGLEGRHEFKGGSVLGAAGEENVFMYGKRQSVGTSYIKIDRITGLLGLGDADDFRVAAEGRSGENPYPSAQRGRTLVYDGRVIGATLPDLRELTAQFRRVAAECREQFTGSITIVDPAATTVGYGAGVRCLALDLDEVQDFGPTRLPTPWIRKFTLGVRMHDPRFVWYPIEEDLANAEGATVVVANEGYAPADLIFNVFSDGDPMDVTIENLTLGKKLVFEAMPIPAGDLLRVDWRNRAAVWAEAANLPDYNPNTDMMPYMNLDDSDWWDALQWGAAPGNNSIKVSGTSVDSWEVSWQHSSY